MSTLTTCDDVPVKEFACLACGSVLVRKPGPGRNPRYCNDRCRYRYQNPPGRPRKAPALRPKAERVEAARNAALVRWEGHEKGPAPARPSRRKERACRFCGVVVLMSAHQQSCGAPECRLARNAERMREGGWPKARRAQRVSTEVEQFSPLDIFERDSWTCGICHRPVDPALRWPDVGSASLDHVIPLSKGGSHTPGNTRCTHLTCNVARGNRADS